MIRTLLGALVLWAGCTVTVCAQSTGIQSLVASIARQYNVDIAIAPELLPIVDSALQSGTGIHSIHELVNILVAEENLSYQLIDGNKLMLRRDASLKGSITALIEGTIISDEEQQPLAYAAVQLDGSNAGTLTDDNGRFILPVSDTTGTLHIHYLGYETIMLPVRDFLQGGRSVRLTAAKIPLDEVIIIIPMQDRDASITQALSLSGYHLVSEDDLMRGNLERMISAMTSYSTFSSDEGIRIRGSQSENSLVLMDGLPVYDPYHFYNIFSPFNSHYFNTIRLYKNNLPVQYGGRIDGMIQLESDRNRVQSHLLFDTDLLLTSLESQLALPNSVVVKFGGRVSHTDIIHDALSDSTRIEQEDEPGGFFQNDNEWTTLQQPTFDFYDFNAGITKHFDNGSKVSVSGFTSYDELENTTVSVFQTTGGPQHHTIDVQQVYDNRDVWTNRGIVGGMSLSTNARSVLHAQVYTSHYHKSVNYVNTTIEERFGQYQERENDGYQDNALSSTGIKSWLQYRVNNVSGWTAGTDLQWHSSEFEARENNESYVGDEQREMEATVFGEYNRQLISAMDVFAGARLTHLQSTNAMYILPNARLHYKVTDRIQLRGAYSKNLQTVYELTVDNRFGREIETLALSDPEEDYPVMTSDKYMIGAGYGTGSFGVDVELFYKKTDGLTQITAVMPDPGHNHHHGGGQQETFYRKYSGEGFARGVDVSVGYAKGKFDGAVFYTLSRIAERYDRLFRGEYYSPEEDRRHQLKISGSYDIGPFEVSSLITYKSKAPYLSFIRLEGRGGLDNVDRESVVRYLPPYFSIDLGVDYAFRLFKQPAQIGVSVINAMNHENIDDVQHLGRVTRDFGQGDFYITQQTELLGRTGNVRFRVVF